MRLAICIPAYNREDYIQDALASCPKPAEVAALGHTLEVLVFDNASTDGTVELARVMNPAPTVTVNSENLGYVGNINLCLELHDRYDWIIVLHSDDILRTSAVLRTIARLENMPDIGMIFGLNETIGHKQRALTLDIDTVWQAGDEALTRMQNSVPCSGVFYNSRAIAKVGGFSAEYPFSADEEYNCRIARTFPVMCSNQIISYYRRHAQNTMLKTWRRSDFIANFLQMRLAMNAMLSAPRPAIYVRQAVAFSLVGQILFCLRQHEFVVAERFAAFGFEHIPQQLRNTKVTAVLAAGIISGLISRFMRGSGVLL